MYLSIVHEWNNCNVDPENRWLLEQWLLFVKEREQLDRNESELRIEANDLELQNEHSRIQNMLRQRTIMSTNFDKADIEVTPLCNISF